MRVWTRGWAVVGCTMDHERGGEMLEGHERVQPGREFRCPGEPPSIKSSWFQLLACCKSASVFGNGPRRSREEEGGGGGMGRMDGAASMRLVRAYVWLRTREANQTRSNRVVACGGHACETAPDGLLVFTF